MNNKVKREQRLFFWLLSLGIMLRYIVMSLGNNFDFDSYCIVGEISGNLRNVYAETTRYNYAPIFLCIQGIFYRISQAKPEVWVWVYRVLIVSILTIADIGIAAFIANRVSWINAIAFFLNPISIVITGYHNQFDNIAVLFALISTLYFNEDENFNKKDVGFVLFFSLSLITKHILFMIPIFILLMKNVPVRKRILYAFVPPIIFLLSFVPFAMSSDAAFQGIVNNVFLYRSFNNAPFLSVLYKLINFPAGPRIIVYGILMVVLAWYVRRIKYEYILLIYLIAMVSFSSAVANQYLAIPMASLCILNVTPWDKVYMIITGLYLFLDGNGLGVLGEIQSIIPRSIIDTIASLFVKGGYIVAVWILFFALLHLMIRNKKGENLIIEMTSK